MRAVIGMTEMFRGMDLKICDELGEEWKRHLLDDKPDYKDQILLSLKMDYNSIEQVIQKRCLRMQYLYWREMAMMSI